MFENLQERLQRTFKSLRGQGVLTEENMQETLRELRLALLEADVNIKVVKQFIDQVQAKAVGRPLLHLSHPLPLSAITHQLPGPSARSPAAKIAS